MNRAEFIASIKADHPDWNAQQIVEYANTPRTIANTVTTIPKPIDFTAISGAIAPLERVKIQNQLSGTYQSLITNINRGSLVDIAHDVENLIAGGLSEDTIAILNAAIADVATGMPNPVTTLYQAPYQDYGLTPIMLSEV